MPKDQLTPSWIKPLPTPLVQRYRAWKATDYPQNKVWYKRLADEGQRPRYMVICCCDSRIDIMRLLVAEPGEIFIHRNIANLVPPCEPDGEHHGTSAALEYAITALHITNLIVLGHSQCGGVKGCHNMCTGKAPELEAPESFVGRWMDILRPGFDRVQHMNDEPAQLRALEQQTVAISLENLMSFPFVAEAVDKDELSLHGLWMDIGSGELHFLQSETGSFAPI